MVRYPCINKHFWRYFRVGIIFKSILYVIRYIKMEIKFYLNGEILFRKCFTKLLFFYKNSVFVYWLTSFMLLPFPTGTLLVFQLLKLMISSSVIVLNIWMLCIYICPKTYTYRQNLFRQFSIAPLLCM